MKHRTQTVWGVVRSNGLINWGSLKWNRRDVIAEIVTEWRRYSMMQRYANLTDAQFWRIIKRTRGMSVRRINMKVARQ